MESALRVFLIAAVVGLCYGISDEVHQSFVPGREASVFDVLADGVGSVVGAWVGVVCARLLRKERVREDYR